MKRRAIRRPASHRCNPPRSAGRSMSWVFVLDHDGGLHPVSRHRALDQAVVAARRFRDRGVDARIQPEAVYHSGGQSTFRGIPLIDTGTEEWTPEPYDVGPKPREAGPSAKSLVAAFGREIDASGARAIRRAIGQAVELGTQRAAEEALRAINRILRGFGVEVVEGSPPRTSTFWIDAVAAYVNTGDSYNTTILYDVPARTWHLTTMGDFVAKRQRAYRIR